MLNYFNTDLSRHSATKDGKICFLNIDAMLCHCHRIRSSDFEANQTKCGRDCKGKKGS